MLGKAVDNGAEEETPKKDFSTKLVSSSIYNYSEDYDQFVNNERSCKGKRGIRELQLVSLRAFRYSKRLKYKWQQSSSFIHEFTRELNNVS